MTTDNKLVKFDLNEITNTGTSLVKNIKNYLLDTNILMSNPNSIFGFEENNVFLCGTVLQELDKHKDDEGERGYNAREAIRIIKGLISEVFTNVAKEDRLRVIREVGISLPNGGRLFFEPDGVDITNLPKGYSIDRADNKIISSCVHMNNDYLKDNPVTLLTNDAGCYINALVCGVNAEDVRNEQVQNIGYTGHLDLNIEDWNIITKIHSDNSIKVDEIAEIANLEYPLLENQFVTLYCGTQSALTVYQKGVLRKIPENISITSKHIKPLNKMQHYAMWALLNPDIPLVILEGQAGTAKTFLSLACGYEQLDVGDHSTSEPYNRILISRPNNRTTDQDFGYLPGDLEEKMGPLMASYMDNLEQILGNPDTPIIQTKRQIEDMTYDGTLEFCPLYTIRGRSIQNGYLICDEAQNATKNLIRDVVTRAGKNTKIVVAGDPRQIDNTSLDIRNNGLVYLKDCMKGSPLCAILRFDDTNCVRSTLAEEAITRMK